MFKHLRRGFGDTCVGKIVVLEWDKCFKSGTTPIKADKHWNNCKHQRGKEPVG